jgi:hypothetical protein
MFDAHVRAWKRHLGMIEMKRLFDARRLIEQGWRVKWLEIEQRRLKDRPWRT